MVILCVGCRSLFTVGAIVNTGRIRTLFQRDAAREAYLGLKVHWAVTLFDVIELSEYSRKRTGGATHTLSARFKKFEVILADVDIERFPRLKTIHERTPIQMSGTIAS